LNIFNFLNMQNDILGLLPVMRTKNKMRTIAQIGAALAIALPLTAFAITSTGGGSFLGNVASAGYGQAKVEICHKGKTMTVAAPAVPTHQDHGDTLGACS
jgi:hypothetical protein